MNQKKKVIYSGSMEETHDINDDRHHNDELIQKDWLARLCLKQMHHLSKTSDVQQSLTPENLICPNQKYGNARNKMADDMNVTLSFKQYKNDSSKLNIMLANPG